jgi:hypothetical protein
VHPRKLGKQRVASLFNRHFVCFPLPPEASRERGPRLDVTPNQPFERFAEHTGKRRRLPAGGDRHGHGASLKCAPRKRGGMSRIVHRVDKDASGGSFAGNLRVHR